MNVRYRVTLSDEERTQLQGLVARGRPKVREVKRAQVLLAADADVADVEIARAVSTSAATVYRTKRCFVEAGPTAALHDAPRPGGARKLSGKEAALLIATACAAPPDGRACSTLELLAGEMVRLTAHASLSGATGCARYSPPRPKRATETTGLRSTIARGSGTCGLCRRFCGPSRRSGAPTSGRLLVAVDRGDVVVSAEPFDAVAIDLARLWVD